MKKNQKRIQLLSDTEVEELYSRPEFNLHEQQLYFTLTPSERTALTQFSNTKTRIYFILQLGYFKVRRNFSTTRWMKSLAMFCSS